MTRQEFMLGWSILVLQPWGRHYNQVIKDGTPTADAVAQFNLYFAKLKWAHPDAWQRVAERYAEGKEWPSVHDLRISLQHANQDYIKPLSDRSEKQFCECPQDVAAILARFRK